MVRLLLGLGANPDAMTRTGETALTLAEAAHRAPVVALFSLCGEVRPI